MLDREWDRPADERSQTASNASSHILAVHDVPGHLENILRVTATIKAQRPSGQPNLPRGGRPADQMHHLAALVC